MFKELISSPIPTHSWHQPEGSLFTKLVQGFMALAFTIVLVATASAQLVQYSQGFEVNNDWGAGGAPSLVTRVPSGTAGIASKTGGFHAQANTQFTRWGGYNSTFPAHGYSTTQAVYLSMTGTNDTRFDFSSAINNTAGNHKRDFVFNAGYYDDAVAPGSGPRFVVSVGTNSGRANSFPKNVGAFVLTSSGWYTLKHRFYDNGGVLAVEMSILNAAGATIHTFAPVSVPADTIGSVGGNRYGWIVNNEFSFLAIDDSERANVIETLYVDDDGTADSSGCDTGTAFTTISAAIAASGPSDTISVCPGTYNESPDINKSLTIQSTGGRDVTTIQLLPSGTPGTPYTGAIHIDNPSANVTIDGFTIIGNDAVGSGLANSNVLVRRANSVTLTNSRVKVGATGPGLNGDDGIGIVNYYGLPTNSITVTNTEFTPTNAEGFRAFYANPGAENFVFQNNQILGHFTRRNITEARTSNISNNVVTGTGPGTANVSGGLGVDNYLNYYPDQSSTFTGNIVSNVSAGLWVGYYSAVSNVTATGNTFINSLYGVSVYAGSSGITLEYNRIAGNSTAGVRNNSASLNAPNNWWGCNYGPGASGAGCTTAANGIVGPVTATPYLTLRSSAAPGGVLTGGTSTISSSLTFNNLNVDTSGSGFVRNGTPASYVGTLGTVAPNPSTTTSGLTSAVFTAGGTPGTGGVATTVDGQTINNPIGVYAGTCVAVSIPANITTLRNQSVEVPIRVDEMTGRGAFGYEARITYDHTKLTYQSFTKVGTLSSGLEVLVDSSTAGVLLIAAATPGSGPALSGSGDLLKFSFFAAGAISAVPTPVNFTNFMFNEGDPCSGTPTNGSVTIISSTISGHVNYVNATSPLPVPRPVPNTVISAAGSVNVNTSTDSAGNYTLSGLGSGAYIVTPSKTAQPIASNNGISNLDSTRILQFLVGQASLTANQQLAADVTNNGTVSNLDASRIAQWSTGIVAPSITGTWKFLPASRNYPDAETPQVNQNYDAILMGDVTGNWNPLGTPGLTSSEDLLTPAKDAVILSAPRAKIESGARISVPITITDTTERGITGYQFDVVYDSSVLEPDDVAGAVAGTVSEGLTVVANSPEKGTLKVFVYGVVPMRGEGHLLDLRFSAIGPVGSSTKLIINDLILNEGEIKAGAVAGELVVIEPSGENTLSGRLLTPLGEAVSGARITLTGLAGEQRSATSNSFGYFGFGDLKLGEMYTISVESRRYRFASQPVSLSGSAATVVLTAQE